MKKLFVLFAAATLLVGFQACKNNSETATEENAVVEAPADTTAAVAPVADTTAAAPAADSTKK